MGLSKKVLADMIALTRASGATFINSAGRLVGVDFATTTAQAGTTGSKSFTIGANRGWVAGQAVRCTPRDGTANILMAGTVTSYDATTGALVVNITAVGSDTTTTKTNWRIGYAGPRLDHSNFLDFVAGNARAGMLVESEARTNWVKNGDAIGSTNGVIGSGGAYPTNWSTSVASSMTFTIIGSGVDAATGLSYVDIRISGTRSGASSPAINLNPTSDVVAAPGELWSISAWVAMVGGSMTNISNLQLFLNERTSGGTFVNNTNGSVTFTPTSALVRRKRAKVMIGATTARVSPNFSVGVPDGSSCDITVRIGGIQMERIRQATRNGTCQAGSTSTTCVLDAGASSVTGDYVGQSLLIVSGTGNGQTKTISAYDGATKTATVTTWTTTPDATSVFCIYNADAPTNGGASSYIPTREIAETRQPDLLDAASFSTWYAAATEGTLFAQVQTPDSRDVMQSPDGSFATLWQDASNFVRLYRTAPTGTTAGAQVKTAGNDQAVLVGGNFNNSVSDRMAVAYKLNDMALSFSGGAAVTDASSPDGMPAPTALRLGRLNDGAPSGAFNGWLKRVRWIPRRVSDAELAALA